MGGIVDSGEGWNAPGARKNEVDQEIERRRRHRDPLLAAEQHDDEPVAREPCRRGAERHREPERIRRIERQEQRPSEGIEGEGDEGIRLSETLEPLDRIGERGEMAVLDRLEERREEIRRVLAEQGEREEGAVPVEREHKHQAQGGGEAAAARDERDARSRDRPWHCRLSAHRSEGRLAALLKGGTGMFTWRNCIS